MTSESNLPQQVKKQLVQAISIKDPNVKIQVDRNAFGWLRLSIVADIFEGIAFEEREHQVDNILKTLNLKLHEYPLANHRLLTPQEEVRERSLSPIQLPL